MNTIKFLILTAIVLFSFASQAEIYKYVDDQGNIHFTDDLNQVPVEQRDSTEASFEYESDLDSEIEASEANTDEVADSADFNRDHISDPELNSSYGDATEQATGFEGETDAEKSEFLVEDQQQEGTSLDFFDDADDQLDMAAKRKQLEDLKNEIDTEYQALVKEKAELAQERESLKNREDIIEFNARVDRLNKRAEAYEQKGKIYKEQIDAYNERISRQNAQINQKAEQN